MEKAQVIREWIQNHLRRGDIKSIAALTLNPRSGGPYSESAVKACLRAAAPSSVRMNEHILDVAEKFLRQRLHGEEEVKKATRTPKEEDANEA